jgi:asparagine synthase (glutamine-hydrolysing)
MCGICGALAANASERVGEGTLHAMCAAIAHRGPDDEGVFMDGPVGLGIRRLSIIDPEGGRQPIQNEDGAITLVFNGEIYNFQELRAELATLGHVFATRADTEVVAHGYEEWGRDVVRRLRGMFAFALWDARCEELFVAVDRFGIKPLYWANGSHGLVFGSELSCLLASQLVARELDRQSLAEYFALGYVPAARSILEGVEKLPPGTHLTCTPGSRPLLETYWRSPAAEDEADADPQVLREMVLAALRDSVRSHLVSDVPLGAFLSGGIDSSVIVALMSEVSPQPVRTFSIGFDDPEHDELDKARLVASRFGTDHHELVVEPTAVDVLPTLVSHFGEPFADSSALPTYHVSALAASSVKVALSGDGGDELFVGYTTFQGVELARALQPLPQAVRRSLGRVAERPPRLPWPGWSDRLGRVSKRVRDSLADPLDAYRSKVALTDPSAVSALLSPELRTDLAARDPFRAITASLSADLNGAHPLERFLRANLEVSLPSDMLVKVDRMSMASSLEVRVPMLDHVLAELVLGLPVRSRFPRWRLKGLLRDSVRDLLPPEIVRQRKHGFTIPVSRWFRGDVNVFAREVLLDGPTARRGFLDGERVERALADHLAGRQNVGAVIWSLLIFELWCRQVLD